MAGGNRQSRLPAWRVTTVISDREIHYPCDFKTCQSLGIDPVRICGRLTEGGINDCQKVWQWMMADPIVPNMRKDIVSYLRIIANEVAIVCLQLSDGIKRGRGVISTSK
jgi:hypothetical protein